MLTRVIELMRAGETLLTKQEETSTVLYLLWEEVEYDGVTCDGACLFRFR